jgi:phosphoglycerol transferase MdoB-like AlkP superfamily enzyme
MSSEKRFFAFILEYIAPALFFDAVSAHLKCFKVTLMSVSRNSPSFRSTPIRALISLPLTLLVFLLCLYGLTRIVILVYTGIDAVPVNLWPVIAVKGLWFDLAVATVMLSPILLLDAALPDRLRRSRLHRGLRLAFLWVAIALLIFGALSEFIFWMEFSTRLNFIAVDYLIYTNEVIGNIRESYPVGWLLSAIAVVSAVITFAVRNAIAQGDQTGRPFWQRGMLAALAVLLPVLSLSMANIDQMQGSGNAYADELSGNGLFTLAAAMRRNELDYQKFYRTMPPAEATTLLRELGVPRFAGNAKPDTTRSPFLRKPKNIVLITVESLSASFVGSYGGTKNLTPKLDAIAKQGLKFDKVFATGTRTVRGLEALSLGTPPIPGQAIVRRPENAHLSTIGEVLRHQGFATYFIYGGYGYFDNMNAYFEKNNYKVYDRTDFEKESVVFENVWGVADEVLFDNILKKMDANTATGQPFFAQIMTTSNHRPYTYPDGRVDLPSPGGRDGAVKYTDYAIGKFIEDAKSKPWFADTLFVIVADHCAAVAGKTKLPVEHYHIPLIFYAPALLKPAIYPHLLSQIDIVPTLLDVAGKKGSELFFGRSAFESDRKNRYAFVSNYQELGYLKDDTLTVLLPKKQVASYRIDPVTYASTPQAVDAALLAQAIAFYQATSGEFKSGALLAPFK